MRAGLFYELDPNSRLSKGLVVFRYRRILQDSPNNYKPIYLVIKKDELYCYYSDYQSREHTHLFRLHYSDHQNPKGKLYRELIGLFGVTKKVNIETTKNKHRKENTIQQNKQPFSLLSYDKGFGTYNKLEVFELPNHRLCEQDPWSLDICLGTVFLDFLYDLKHSDVFANTPYFDKLKTLIRENFLFSAILAKAEYYFQRELLNNLIENNSLARDQKNKRLKFINQSFLDSEKKFLKILIQENAPDVLTSALWFNSQIERETDNILVFEKKISTRSSVRKINQNREDDLIGQVSDWYLLRYNFQKARTLIVKSHPLNGFLLFLPIIFVISYWIWQLIGDRVFIGYKLMHGGVLLSAFAYILFDNPPNKTIHYHSIVNFISPRLIITLCLVWVAFLQADTQIKYSQRILPYFVLPFIIAAYLFKEIKAVAPDLKGFTMLWRIVNVMIRVFLITFVIGILIMDLYKVGEEIDQIDCLGLIVYPSILKAKIFWVFFTTLFLNFLFEGKRFTGF